MGLNEAIVTGEERACEPLLMTTLAMIFGMVPLALSRGEGSKIWMEQK